MMAPNDPKDKAKADEVGAGLRLVSDRTRSWEWESVPRRERRPRDRLTALAPWKSKRRSPKLFAPPGVMHHTVTGRASPPPTYLASSAWP